jgi:adenylyl-sulfate kinase
MTNPHTGHHGGILWLTGLSGAGKTTIANGVASALLREGYFVHVLDGDVLRAGLNADLGFSQEDRRENVRRIGEVACLFADAGLLCLVAVISPYESGRQAVRARAAGRLHEVFVAAPREVCEARDPKGLYARARHGEIAQFTGVSSPYEPPGRPELILDTAGQSQEQSIAAMLDYIHAHYPQALPPRSLR